MFEETIGTLPPNTLPLLASLLLNAALVMIIVNMKNRQQSPKLPPGASALDAIDAKRKVRQAEGKGRPRQPISSLTGAVEQLKTMHEEFKYLKAGDLLDDLREALSSSATNSWGGWGAADAQRQLDALLKDGVLEERIKTARGAVRDLSNNDGFEVIAEDETMKVMQRLTPDYELTCKVEAVLEGVKPADCLMIWREGMLYPSWFPFVTGGKMLSEVHHAECILHLLIETTFMSVDMVLWGWGCDNLDDNEFLMCVRPVTSRTVMPSGVEYPPPGSGSRAKTLFGSLRAKAVIDILVEPLSETSARFAFQMTDQMPKFLPLWAINYVMENAMTNIFNRMKEVAVRMAKNDLTCEHLQHVNRPAYAPTRAWIESKISKPGLGKK